MKEEKGKTQSETREKKKIIIKKKKKLNQRDTRSPNEVRPQTSVTRVEKLLSTRDWS